MAIRNQSRSLELELSQSTLANWEADGEDLKSQPKYTITFFFETEQDQIWDNLAEIKLFHPNVGREDIKTLIWSQEKQD
jgi:hypothetical protein